MHTLHSHAVSHRCPNCGSLYLSTTAAAAGLAQADGRSHTHSILAETTTLSPDVIKEFAKPDPDADLNEWRKNHIG